MASLPYPDRRLADDSVVLRRWAESDVRCVEDEKRCDVDEARLWISRQWRRQAEGAGVCLAIADAATDEALGCIGLLFRTKAGTVPVAASGGSDAAGLGKVASVNCGGGTSEATISAPEICGARSVR